ncbi:hypothetical protein EGW08_016338, partial [Elysia chlorotica]
MLLVLCGVYIFCTLPGIVFQIFTFITDEFSVFGRYRNTYKLTTAISLLTQFINSSINFVIYMAMNERFARSYVDLFGCSFLLRSKDEAGEKDAQTKPTMGTSLASKTEKPSSTSDAT